MPKHIKTADILNKIFGRLTIIEDLGTIDHVRFVMCQCQCGNVSKHRLSGLRNKKKPTQSCGCLNTEALFNSKFKHGLMNEKLYHVWGSMKGRCSNKNDKSYYQRGIKVCTEWRNDFLSFYNWALFNGYKEGLTIDRIDNNGNYEPANCRWVTNTMQQRNVRKNVIIEYNLESKCLAEWCEIYGLNYKLSHQRMFRNNVSFEDLIKNKGKNLVHTGTKKWV